MGKRTSVMQRKCLDVDQRVLLLWIFASAIESYLSILFIDCKIFIQQKNFLIFQYITLTI